MLPPPLPPDASVVAPPPSPLPSSSSPPQPAAISASTATSSARTLNNPRLLEINCSPPPSDGPDEFCTLAQPCGGRSGKYPGKPRDIQLCAVGLHSLRAEVAELVDAPDSKSGSLRGVWVRFPPSASRSSRRRLPKPARGYPFWGIRASCPFGKFCGERGAAPEGGGPPRASSASAPLGDGQRTIAGVAPRPTRSRGNTIVYNGHVKVLVVVRICGRLTTGSSSPLWCSWSVGSSAAGCAPPSSFTSRKSASLVAIRFSRASMSRASTDVAAERVSGRCAPTGSSLAERAPLLRLALWLGLGSSQAAATVQA